MVCSLADHIIGAGIFLISFIVTDWAQKVPSVKFSWPRAWEDMWEHGRTDESPDAEGLPGTDLARLQQGIPDVLAQVQRLQSSVSDGRKELLGLTKKMVRFAAPLSMMFCRALLPDLQVSRPPLTIILCCNLLIDHFQTFLHGAKSQAHIRALNLAYSSIINRCSAALFFLDLQSSAVLS